MDSISITSEIVTSATALAGLVLVYLGGLANSFGSFEATERRAASSRFQRRAWVAFAGLILALVTAALGVLGKWLPNECIADSATVLLLISFAWGAGIALMTTLEIG